MKKNLIVYLVIFLTVPVLASYSAKQAHKDSNESNYNEEKQQYPELLAKVEDQIKQDAAQGAYSSLFIVVSESYLTVKHVVRTLRLEGYTVDNTPSQHAIVINW